jgi:hypothetical protein
VEGVILPRSPLPRLNPDATSHEKQGKKKRPAH